MVGAGPAGLLLASELHRLGVDVVVLEHRTDAGAGTRAIGVHGPTLAALERSGATDRVLAEAARIPRGIARARGRTLGEVRFDRLRARYPFVAAVPQSVTEAAVGVGGPRPLRGVEVLAVTMRPDRVILTARTDAGEIEFGARATVVASGAAGRELASPLGRARRRAYEDRYLMTDLLDAPGQPGDTAIITLDPEGVLESFPLPCGGRRLVAWDREDGPDPDRSAEEATVRLRRAVAERGGEPQLAARIESATTFGIRRVLLDRMRYGRAFVIGDAAHEVSPIGGQGMNLGLLDAATLAPILARRLRGEDMASEFERWERNRLASARTAARLAGLNTALGRGRSRMAIGAMAPTVAAALSTPLAQLAARAYAMGFDGWGSWTRNRNS